MRQQIIATALAIVLTAAAHADPFACPQRGGDFVFGLEAPFETLDPMASAASATRGIVLNIYETLITQDENNAPILELAESLTESADHLTFAFRLRPGVVFHNGKPMTSADVAASFDRYAKAGAQSAVLEPAAGWEAPDPATFVIRMKTPQPSFVEALSSLAAPIAIMPAENRDVPAGQPIGPAGTGPYRLEESVPGAFVKALRFDGYKPNTAFSQRTGYGGYKLACLDSIVFRVVEDPASRADGLRTGEMHAADDLPAGLLPALRADPDIAIFVVRDWQLQIAAPNVSAPPTDNLLFRRAVQAALDMDEIMDAASDGQYSTSPGFLSPGQPAYTDAGKETYNIRDPDKAKALLLASGYHGEPVILLTNKEQPPMYNAALVMQQQMQSVGINAEMKVVDGPAAARMSHVSVSGWNFFFTAWGTQSSLGALSAMRRLAGPNPIYRPRDGEGDPDLLAAWAAMNDLPDARDRGMAFARMQAIALEKVFAIPFGWTSRIQGARSNVKGFVPFRIPRLANVWFAR